MQTFADKYAGTPQGKLAKQRYDDLAKQDADAQKAKEKIAKVNAILEKQMIKVEGGNFKLTKKQTVAVNDFYIGKYEVTIELWELVTGQNCENLPQYADNVKYKRYSDGEWTDENYYHENLPAYFSHGDILKFIEKLNELTDKHFRLPTETEWVYAARGGNLE
ncbi:hypothetical protein FACS1894182_02790 [Bacteroidia bacterium]|nr:hypothetical protein FACS1894182_02790 [Bacteroidia bacterium]